MSSGKSKRARALQICANLRDERPHLRGILDVLRACEIGAELFDERARIIAESDLAHALVGRGDEHRAERRIRGCIAYSRAAPCRLYADGVMPSSAGTASYIPDGEPKPASCVARVASRPSCRASRSTPARCAA